MNWWHGLAAGIAVAGCAAGWTHHHLGALTVAVVVLAAIGNVEARS